MNLKDTAVIILAAGKGKRMNNPEVPKVLAELSGKPLIAYVLDQVKILNPNKVIVIAGHKKEKLIDYVNNQYLKDTDTNLKIGFAVQAEQLGTGHAVMQAATVLSGFKGNVLILAGDVPLLKADSLLKFIELSNNDSSDLSVLSTSAKNPFAYGRILRDQSNKFVRIVEEKDATDLEKAITEINSGVFYVKSEPLFASLKQIKSDNAQKEYYLTDIIEIMNRENYNVNAYNCADFDELRGVNSPEDLRNVELVLNNSLKQ